MATEVNFYHLTRSSLEDTLPRLLTKTLQAGERAVVLVGSPKRVDALNTHLWVYDPDGFLPHGLAGGPHDALQPVLLTTGREAPNRAQCLMAVDGAEVSAADCETVERAALIELSVKSAPSTWTNVERPR